MTVTAGSLAGSSSLKDDKHGIGQKSTRFRGQLAETDVSSYRATGLVHSRVSEGLFGEFLVDRRSKMT